MNLVLFVIVTLYIINTMSTSSDTTQENAVSEESFEEKLNKGRQLLKNNYVQAKNDQIEHMGDTIEEVNEYSKIDTALFQGDMILTKRQAEEVIEGIEAVKNNITKRQAYVDRRYPQTLWPNKHVYYTFYRNATRDRIVVFKEVGCWSHVGRIGGPQGLSLGSGCESVGTAAHELAHAMGFFHMQSRYDRDDFITLKMQNFKGDWASQFTKQSSQTNYNYGLTYDYGGIMHYGPTSVSKNGQPVMVTKDINYMQTLGSPMISFYEKLMMNKHYNCNACSEKFSAICQNNGFPHPRYCYKCICPSGYGGDLCDEKPSGCGETLKASDTYKTLKNTVGDKYARQSKDDFEMCYYWIEAPAGKQIEVILDSYTDGVATDGCRYGGVEIKTGSDKRHTGYRFCSKSNVGTHLISTYSTVPVVTYSRAWELTTTLRYRIGVPRCLARFLAKVPNTAQFSRKRFALNHVVIVHRVLFTLE
ncbi:astacin [Dictyocaulus viviparus]|uniref:Zinc metalloproteinase n=1 Tax=Dictyocaulus viviparus TaxID=29172 RepID=A0A0D8XBI2_DICVI|nr:astacin [Dictyocaulus viviparus]